MTTDQVLAAIAGAMGIALCVVIAWAIKHPRQVKVARGNRPPHRFPVDADMHAANDTHPNQPVRDCIAAIRREQEWDVPGGFRYGPLLSDEMLRVLERVKQRMELGANSWIYIKGSDDQLLADVQGVIRRVHGE